MFLSEKLYWLILIAGFTAFAALLWFWLIPCQIIEYNLAVNLFTSSIFMVLTVVFLSWLFSLREKAEWNNVKNEVFFNIRLELATLFDEILEYLEGGLDLKISLLGEKDKQKNREMISSGLKKLKDSKIVPTSLAVSSFFKDQQAMELFLNVERRLGDVQTKYSKHLSADITVSLMKLQHSIWALESIKAIQISFQKLSGKPSTTIPTSFLPLIVKEFEKIQMEMVQAPLIALTKEIERLYSMGLKFNYPY